MPEILIETIELKNSLTLELYDGSKQIAPDRWMVALIARLTVPVDPSVAVIDEIDWGAIKATLGSNVVFEQKRERNFVANDSKDAVFNALQDNFKAALMTYLAHPEFAKRFILSRYKKRRSATGHAGS